MNRRAFQFFACLTWMTLPLVALRYWQVWAQLPLRMATHFGVNGQPNGWMSRDVALCYSLGIPAILLAVFTGILLAYYSAHPPDATSWAVLAFFYFVLGFVMFANYKVLDYNLMAKPVELGPSLLLVPLAVVILLAVFLRAGRGQPLATAHWLAQETHASPLFGMLFLLPLFVEFRLLFVVPSASVRVSLALMCLLFLAIAVFAWSGFRYYFGPHGVEVRALGYRLRSIAAGDITSYDIQPWNLLRGYGIRGIGGTRAYVWCNRVVHIRTPQGEVFLGHRHPERIIHDLDLVIQANRRP